MARYLSAIQKNPKYEQTQFALQKVRDAIKGSTFVKAKGTTYLKSPSEVDSGDIKLGNNRYQKYIEGAEFDDFVAQTQRTMTGKLSLTNVNIELDSPLDRLESDVDNDGTTIQGAMQDVSNNVLAAKYHIGLADYQGLSDLAAESISIGELEDLDPRATIKFYPREDLIDWDFERVNGRMQITYMMLQEVNSILDKESLQRTTVISYLILSLDEDGFYYQEKLTEVEGKGGYNRSERNYLQVDGVPLDFIPVYFFSDEEIPKGSLPAQLGMLSALSDIAYSKYSVSADYKEAMRQLPPTTYIKGMDNSDLELFEVANGRNYIQTGAGCVNILPGEDADVVLLGADTQLNFYTQYLDDSDDKVRALGGVFDTDDAGNRTAEEARIDNAEQNAVLVGLADSIRNGFTKLISYCALFEGLTTVEDVDQYDVDIDLSTDFGKVKLSADEVRVNMELFREQIIDEEELARVLKEGGWLLSDVEDLIGRLNTTGRLITPSANPVGAQTIEAVPDE